MSLNNTACYYLSTEEAEAFVYSTTETVLITVFLPVVSAIGILLNAAFLFTVYRVEDMRTTTNIYLANLAVADEMLLVIRLANYLGRYLYLPIRYSVTPFTNRFICGTPLLLIFLFSFASVFFISLVAFERYMAICRPSIHRQTNSRTRAFRLSLMSWIASLVIVACHSGSFSISKYCFIFPTAPKVLMHILISFRSELSFQSMTIIDSCQFLLACIGNCSLYVCIVRRLNRRQARNTSRERNYVAKMLAINACVFFICMAPIQITNLVDLHFEIFGSTGDFLGWIAVVTASLNSTINPLIYNVVNPDYRKAFRRAFTKRQRSPLVKYIVRRRSSQLDREEECPS